MGATRASSLVGLLGYLVLSDSLLIAGFFGASFVGMSSKEKVGKINLVISSVVFAIVFLLFTPLLEGHGGALGVSAFICVVFTMLVAKIRRYLYKKWWSRQGSNL